MARICGPVEFREWLHGRPCAVCRFSVFIEQAHAKGGGIARKADWTATFPLCGPHYEPCVDHGGYELVEGCHRELHRIGVKSFEQRHGVTLLSLVADTQQQWQAVCAGGSGGGGTPA